MVHLTPLKEEEWLYIVKGRRKPVWNKPARAISVSSRSNRVWNRLSKVIPAANLIATSPTPTGTSQPIDREEARLTGLKTGSLRDFGHSVGFWPSLKRTDLLNLNFVKLQPKTWSRREIQLGGRCN
jgi:hypothetical protein